MRTKPAPQERPEPFHSIHMDFTKAVAIFVSSKFTPSMVDTLMIIFPDLQTGINAILVCINKCTWNNGVLDEGFYSLLLHIGQQINHYLTAALNHSKDGWSFLLQRPTTGFAFESAPRAFSPFVLHHLRPASAARGRSDNI